MKIDVNKFLNPRHSEFFRATDLVLLFYGGAGAGKSFSTADRLLLAPLLHRAPVKTVVIRRSMPSLRRTCAAILQERARTIGIPYDLNQRDMTAVLPYGGQIIYVSVNNPAEIDKLRSLTDVDLVWIEEADEVDEAVYDQAGLRLRGGVVKDKSIILTLNPVSVSSWPYRRFIDRQEPARHIRVTYKDNPFIDQPYAEKLESLQDLNEQLYRVYTLGEWGHLTETILTNWTQVDVAPQGVKDTVIGLDFGYNNPSAACRIYYLDDPKTVLIEELLYETKLTTPDLIDRLKTTVHPGELIFADSAEPDRITELRRAGFKVREANKEVNPGIQYMQTLKLQVLEGSDNLVKELRSYEWQKDRAGNRIDKPVKFRDHCLTGDTMVETLDGPTRIDSLVGTTGQLHTVNPDDNTYTTASYRDVRLTRANADILEITTEDGRVIRCTEDHLILTTNGWKEAGTLTESDTLIDIQDEIDLKSRTIVHDGLRFVKDKDSGYYNSTQYRMLTGRNISLHRYIYQQHHGPIPKGHDVHHIDGNKDNNDISNLQLIDRSTHLSNHAKNWSEERLQQAKDIMNNIARPAASEWHRSPAGRAWHRIHAREIADKIAKREIVQTCKMCGKSFTAPHLKQFCHLNCKAKHFRITHPGYYATYKSSKRQASR